MMLTLLRCVQQIVRDVQPIDWNRIFALRKRAAAWSWRFDCKSCTVSKVNSQPDQGSSSSSQALTTEQHWVRGCNEAHALLGSYSESPFA